ncbi:uncharacterized protein B0H64DRAFT_468436 [Chaetomium fimeti]|uniref:Uncharacterized protein n=1 Tax=Chaetomium fimeti TaxID=1854472 RepID=A0AAE0H8D1_9PEZI|nr:hypothetical protein B0H64DRAFT_468436 [Chaetomium fimeti]
MDANANGQTNNDRASHSASERKDAPIQDKKLGEQDTTTSDRAKKGQPLRLSSVMDAVRIPADMTEETWLALRQANIDRYWEAKKLAEETAKNTESNKNIAFSDQTCKGKELNKKVKWADVFYLAEPQEPRARGTNQATMADANTNEILSALRA